MYITSHSAEDPIAQTGGRYTNLLTGVRTDAGTCYNTSGGSNGNQVFSWRTGKTAQAAIEALGRIDYTGEDIRNLIYSGEEFDLDFDQGSGSHIIPTGANVADTRWTSSSDNGHECRVYKSRFTRPMNKGAFNPYEWYSPIVSLTGKEGSSAANYRYDGPLHAVNPLQTIQGFTNPIRARFTEDTWILSQELRNWIYSEGNRAISSSRPTAPQASLAVFIGELKQLPSMPLMQLIHSKGIRSAGSEYLNVQFGWRPMLRDLQKGAMAFINCRTLLYQYVRDAEMWISRSRNLHDFDRELVSDVLTSSNGAAVASIGKRGSTSMANNMINFQQGRGTFYRKKTGKMTFSGAFSYFLPEANTLLGKMELAADMADLLLGAKLSADDMWALTPWSWLLDWMGSIGKFISRMDALSSNGLVLRYGYISLFEEFEYTINTSGLYDWYGTVLPSAVFTEKHSLYTRLRSYPFGFQLSADFNPQQWAILAALGMTRGPRSLRID